jgi:ribose 5-phosphate isomerase A
MNTKQLVAEKAVAFIRDGMTIGLGTGSTATIAIKLIGNRVRDGLRVQAVASSLASEALARELLIPVIPFSQVSQIDITIDGADEIDPMFNLVKGGGGALTREKILAHNSDQLIIIADQSKLVGELGQFPLAVEVLPFASELTAKQLGKLGCSVQFRKKEGSAFVTDNGNFIADCSFGSIKDSQALNATINTLPGVVESGLFPGKMVHTVLIAYTDGSFRQLKQVMPSTYRGKS